MKWIIQQTPSNSDSDRLIQACKDTNTDFTEILSLVDLERLPQDKAFIYGSIPLGKLARSLGKWNPGAGIEVHNFDFNVWRYFWKENCLNFSAKIWFINEFYEKVKPNDCFFIRPCVDDKSFTGTVMTTDEFKQWYFSAIMIDPDFAHTVVAVADPNPPDEEWRLFIVNKKVSTGSLYQRNGKAAQSDMILQEIIDFGEKIADIWSPASLFSLDVGKVGDKLYVIEAGCLNSSGLYGANCLKLIKDINNSFSYA